MVPKSERYSDGNVGSESPPAFLQGDQLNGLHKYIVALNYSRPIIRRAPLPAQSWVDWAYRRSRSLPKGSRAGEPHPEV